MTAIMHVPHRFSRIGDRGRRGGRVLLASLPDPDHRAWGSMSTSEEEKESAASAVAVADAVADPAAGSDSRAKRGPRWREPWLIRLAWLAGLIAAGIGLYLCYLYVSRTARVGSDGASNALQAWDMLHGNPLLRGWTVSDVSFYPTELPQYALVELIRGLRADVVDIAAAMTYTLVVLLAALVAKGTARGRQALVRVAMVAGIMLAPQLGSGAN